MTTNSAGFSGAKPTTTTTIPFSMSSCVIVVASQRTKYAASGVVPWNAPFETGPSMKLSTCEADLRPQRFAVRLEHRPLQSTSRGWSPGTAPVAGPARTRTRTMCLRFPPSSVHPSTPTAPRSSRTVFTRVLMEKPVLRRCEAAGEADHAADVTVDSGGRFPHPVLTVDARHEPGDRSARADGHRCTVLDHGEGRVVHRREVLHEPDAKVVGPSGSGTDIDRRQAVHQQQRSASAAELTGLAPHRSPVDAGGGRQDHQVEDCRRHDRQPR